MIHTDLIVLASQKLSLRNSTIEADLELEGLQALISRTHTKK